MARRDPLVRSIGTIGDGSVLLTVAGPARSDELLRALESKGLAVRIIDGSLVGTEMDVMTMMAAAWSFPSYFGHNWDALDDCLLDMGWIEAGGYVTFFAHADALIQRQPNLALNLIRTFIHVGEVWAGGIGSIAERGAPKPFSLVFLLDDGAAT